VHCEQLDSDGGVHPAIYGRTHGETLCRTGPWHTPDAENDAKCGRISQMLKNDVKFVEICHHGLLQNGILDTHRAT
jgi:hypothetical protein